MAELQRAYPTTAADYKLHEEIGQGVSAVVYRATCLPYMEVVAVKVLDLEKCNNSLDEIRKEAQTMSLINHPNVVKAYCSFVVDVNLWVVMPFLAGGSCLHIMKSAYPEGFDEPVIATVLKETLKALDYLHRHGHIHRDVKAGNILIDTNGTVKLADYGVSAFMFDSGDRQRSRQTFVGTPCWMAPEVMEQVHGYDFRADIWSFGITALELAHGHAPFSKYPPMKVLLMTLQNAPPGLDYPQDKRFSKSFKELIGLCLVKEPGKRPTAEKLLKHSFFKHAKTADYIQRHILDALPPLGERVKNLKAKDAARRAQAKMPMIEQEERSNNEYKRGVSGWNFDLDDLKAQAALMEDDEPPARDDRSRRTSAASVDEYERESPPVSAVPTPSAEREGARFTDVPLPSALSGKSGPSGPSLRGSASDKEMKPLSSTSQREKPKNFSGPLPMGRKEPKHVGRFDVFEDDNDTSPDYRARDRDRLAATIGPTDRLGGSSKDRSGDRGSAVVGPSLSMSRDRDRSGNDSRRDTEYRASEGERRQGGNGGTSSRSTSKDGDGKPAPVVQKKGRFSVSEEVEEPHMHKSASVPDWPADREKEKPAVRFAQTVAGPQSRQELNVLGVSTGGETVPVSAVLPHLQSLMHHAAVQQDVVLALMNSLSPADLRQSYTSRRDLSRTVSAVSGEFSPLDLPTERERELQQQVIELQTKVASLLDDIQTLKGRNAGLERQLNQIHNEEEERRIKAEEEADADHQ
ncbi:Serine Threonine protein kinase [Klebsormidium nitens]|uniref:Serine Threonine protein kinase n=1 Tax=Klebsormidium nitens TaxID=105231 RepID=A0A1Y1IQ85_KLENI|nr:Serine Threonine protein kinase [Klebsormidium nitens]|eukprot:GAQ92864.1 Serine Threonine protein kinase [Klebsormidium nitens]